MIDLEEMPVAVVRFFASLPRHAWSAAFHPAPQFMPPHMTTADLIAPWAYLILLMTVSMLWSQFWLFVFSALGVAWINTQVAWQVHEKNGNPGEADANLKLQTPTIIHPPEELKVDPATLKEPEEPTADSVDMGIMTTKEAAMAFADNITTATVCVMPANVMTNRFSAAEQKRLEEEIGRSLAIQRQYQAADSHRYLPYEGLQAVPEEDEECEDAHVRIPDREAMDTIRKVPVQVPGLAPSASQNSALASQITDNSLDAAVIPPEIPPYPRALCRKASDDVLDDNVSNITSMEELELEPSTAAVRPGTASSRASSEADSFRDLSTAISDLPKKDRNFPIIDDVLSEYEASLHSIDHRSNISPDLDEALTSGDESHANGTGIFSDLDESRPESPATSISSDDEEDECIENTKTAGCTGAEVAALKPVQAPQASGTTGITRPVPRSMPPVPATTNLTEDAKNPKSPAIRKTNHRSKSKPTNPPRKNNGWKRIPKRHRLSKSSKKRFVSRAVW